MILNTDTKKADENSMSRYTLSIETNDHSITIGSFATKKEGLKQAAYFRTGGLGWDKQLTATENPNSVLYDSVKQEQIYCQPLFKYALKK